MKVKAMEHYDEFGSDVVCWVEVEDVPDYFKFLGKQIDGEAYLETCFGVCVGRDEDGWYVCQDAPSCELFYIDDDGEKHWMPYVLTEDENKEVIKFCKNYIEGKDGFKC
jgi:hypothetical protein